MWAVLVTQERGGLERSQNYYDQEKQGAVFIPLLHMVWGFNAVITIVFNANDLTLSQQMLINSNLATEHTEHHNGSSKTPASSTQIH